MIRILHCTLPTLGALICSLSQASWSMEKYSALEIQEKPSLEVQKRTSVLQLAKGVGNSLEAPLGTGVNVLLKMSIDLEGLKNTDQEHPKVPVKFFLTDFTSSPINHPAVDFQVKVDCEVTPLKCVLPNKPESFDNYTQFKKWMKQGYFTNQVNICYDFHIDLQKLAPSLAQHLFFLPPQGYHFIGTHAIDNTKIIPERCVPNISYISQRGNTNATIVTLGGILYLNKKPYPIENHQQVFPHQKVSEIVFKQDRKNKFYHHQWIAQSEIISKITYKECSNKLAKLWPEIPSGDYSIVQREPGDKEAIVHLVCINGLTGEVIDITHDDKIFFLFSEARDSENGLLQELIVRDRENQLYITQYNISPTHSQAQLISQHISSIKASIECIIPKIEKLRTMAASVKNDNYNACDDYQFTVAELGEPSGSYGSSHGYHTIRKWYTWSYAGSKIRQAIEKYEREKSNQDRELVSKLRSYKALVGLPYKDEKGSSS